MATLREQGKRDWTANESIPHIQTGALQRIADACELMAKNHVELIAERDKYKRWYEGERAGNNKARHREAALRGIIKKLKVKS